MNENEMISKKIAATDSYKDQSTIQSTAIIGSIAVLFAGLSTGIFSKVVIGVAVGYFGYLVYNTKQRMEYLKEKYSLEKKYHDQNQNE